MTNTRRRFLTNTGTLLAAAGAARAYAPDIFEAAATGNIERAKELCAAGPSIVNLRSDDGRTPLHFAAAGGQVDMIMFLNSQGANLSAGPESPILTVADYPDLAVATDMARTLLGNASDPNARRKDGATALHVAAMRGNAEIVKILIHRGARVGAQDGKGRTPAEVATGDAVAILRDPAKIEQVYFGGRYTQDLRGGKVTRDDTNGLPQEVINQFATVAHFDADKVKQMHKVSPALLTTRSTWDELAVEAAAHMGLVPLTEYLADAGSPISTCTATLLGLTDVVKTMVRSDHNRVRERGAHDFGLLLYTAFGKEQTEIAALLIESGADVDSAGFGQTPLQVAAGKGHLELAKLLLDRGAQINAVSRSRKGPGPTPLAIALKQKQSKMADFLTERGGRT